MLATLDSSLQYVLATVLLTVGALLPIVDPLGAAPFYLQMTSGLRPEERAAMAKAVARDSFLLLLACSLVGAYVLDFFGLSIPAVQIAGGIVLCTMGWKLLNRPDVPDAGARATAAEADTGNLRRRAFYPLTMPLTVGPGSISVAITLGANPHPDVRSLFVTALGHALGILVVAASVYLCYRYAHALVRWLGDTGRTVVLRLSSFILLCIGVQIAWNGIHALIVATFPGSAG
jgi:multiple antibiotic resistance protein